MIEESKYQEAKEELIGILNSLGKPMINNKSAIKKLLTISVPLREAKENEEEIKKIMLEIFDDVYDEFMKEKENSRDENKEPTIAEKAEAFNLLIRDNISRIKKENSNETISQEKSGDTKKELEYMPIDHGRIYPSRKVSEDRELGD